MSWNFELASARSFPQEPNYQILVSFPSDVCPLVDPRGLPKFTLVDNGDNTWSLTFYFQDLHGGGGEVAWDTGVLLVPGLRNDLLIDCDVQGVVRPPRTQTVTIRRSGGGGPGVRYVKPSVKGAGKAAKIRRKKRGEWVVMRRNERAKLP